MIRLLVLCEFGSCNGGENSLLTVLPGLAAHGFYPVVACPGPSELMDQLIDQGVETVSWDPRHFPRQGDSIHYRREMIGQLIRQVQPGLLHSNSLAMSRLAGPVASHLGLPSLGYLRDMMNLSQQAIQDLNCQGCLIAVSHATREWYVARGVDPRRIHVIYNGVDAERFFPAIALPSLQEELGLSSDTLILGGIGQLGLRKGWEILLDAMKLVCPLYPSTHLVLVGTRHSQKQEARDYEQQLIDMANQELLKGHVHFLGRREDISELLRQWILLVHPARQEPLGRVLLEAAASGCPVVATDVGGTREIFPAVAEDGALLVADNSPQDLAAAICQVLRDPALAQSLSQQGRQRAISFFDVATAVEQLSRHYHELIAR